MNWKHLTQQTQLDEIDQHSRHKPVLIYKHSTHCSISGAALSSIEQNWKEEDGTFIEPYYLDLIAHRAISNEIAKRYNVPHESPQVLLIKNGKCIYTESHMSIALATIRHHLIG